MRDLGVTGAPSPVVEDSNWQDSVDDAESAFLRSGDGSGMGAWVDTHASEAEQIAMVGDQVQEWVIEELAAAGRPTNWPPCPHHPRNHPLVAQVHDRVAVWSCPTTGAVVAEIGQLPAV